MKDIPWDKLASYFNSTVDVVKNNAPYWLAKYWWYSWAVNLWGVVVIGMLITAATVLIFYFKNDFDYLPIEDLKKALIISSVFILIALILHTIPMFIAPDLAGMEALIRTFK